MAFLFRPTYTTKDSAGKRVKKKAKAWYGRYTDASGTTCQTKLSANKTAASQMLNELVRQVELGKAGIADPYRQHRNVSLTAHLDAYRQHHADKGNTEREGEQVVGRCRRVIEGCEFALLSDLDHEAAARWLADRRGKPRKEGGIGPQTFNHYVTALKSFGNWLVRTKRTGENPFRYMTKLNPETEIRCDRRPLTDDEFARLVAAARAGKRFRKLVGPDRAMLYLVGAVTGLRASELASLTAASFALDADPPTVTVEAAYSKHRRRDVVPLHPSLVAELRPWLASRAADGPLWPGKWAKHGEGVDMIRRDLAVARAAWIVEVVGQAEEVARRERSDFLTHIDSAGRVADFHALRHRFVTGLVNAGVAPKDAQALARHSTITLTMDRYSHVELKDTAAAVARLPVVLPVATAAACTPACTKLALPADPQRSPVSLPDPSPAQPVQCKTRRFQGEIAGFPCDSGLELTVPPTGIEPVTYGLGNRRSIR